MSAPWMPLYVADYLADTGHLSAAEHGAYMLLIMHYWRQGGLPADEGHLQRISRMTPAEWRRSRDTLAAFFKEGWKHDRIDDELKRAGEKSGARAEAGKRGGHAKAAAANSLKNNKPPLANATDLPQQKPAVALASSSQSQSHTEEASPSEKAQAPELDEDADLFRRGRELLGRNAGGQIAKLKTAFQGSVPKARAAVEQAFGRDSPSEYIAGVIRRQGECPPTRAGPAERSDSNAVGRNILAELRAQREQNSHTGPDWDRPEIFSAPAALQIR